jgi:tRNA pseudouridine55 synthase
MYSAIKIEGKKLCDLARSGITVERKARKIIIHSLKLLRRDSDSILIDATCSKGTYIRTLCQDIGKRLNLPATMSFLVRTRVGKFELADAWLLEEIEEYKIKACLRADDFLDLPAVKLDAQKLLFFATGRKIIVDWDDGFIGQMLTVTDGQDRFAGIGRAVKLAGNRAWITPVKVMASSEQTNGDLKR